jgi:colanic acid biosynthesis protein WcaH
MVMKLTKDDFVQIVKNTPLIAIDLIIENMQGEILLGWRTNQPAKGFWFVPGGRILKNEPFLDAFARIGKAETGMDIQLEDSIFLGIYEHIYPNENFNEDPSFGTHYINLAYRVKLSDTPVSLPPEQHTNYWWATLDEVLEDPNVHENTRNYFNGHPSFTE